MNIAKIIDHTNIKPTATARDIEKTCREARRCGFRGVCVNPQWIKLVKKELNNSDIKAVVLIDGPMGQSPTAERLRMCKKAKKDGADELDVVMNIVDLKYEMDSRILNDLKKLCKILPTKVIIGSGYLTDEEIDRASRLAKEAGAVCVKTATFGDPLEHRELKEKAAHLKIMKKAATGLEIKASGSIKTLKDLRMMVNAGADIIGTSNSINIMKEIER